MAKFYFETTVASAGSATTRVVLVILLLPNWVASAGSATTRVVLVILLLPNWVAEPAEATFYLVDFSTKNFSDSL